MRYADSWLTKLGSMSEESLRRQAPVALGSPMHEKLHDTVVI